MPVCVIRRNAQVAKLKHDRKLDFLDRWSLKLATWVEHLYRHQESPSFLLLQCKNDVWLRTCRFLAGSDSIEAGVTATRASPGFPWRWGEKWIE